MQSPRMDKWLLFPWHPYSVLPLEGVEETFPIQGTFFGQLQIHLSKFHRLKIRQQGCTVRFNLIPSLRRHCAAWNRHL